LRERLKGAEERIEKVVNEYSTVKKSLTEELRATSKELAVAERKVEKLEKDKRELIEENNELKERASRLERVEEKFQEATEEWQKKEQELRRRLEAAEKAETGELLKDLQKADEKCSGEKQKLKEARDAALYAKEAAEAKSQKIEREWADITELQRRLHTYEEERKDFRKRLEENEERLTRDHEDEIITLRKRWRVNALEGEFNKELDQKIEEMKRDFAREKDELTQQLENQYMDTVAQVMTRVDALEMERKEHWNARAHAAKELPHQDPSYPENRSRNQDALHHIRHNRLEESPRDELIAMIHLLVNEKTSTTLAGRKLLDSLTPLRRTIGLFSSKIMRALQEFEETVIRASRTEEQSEDDGSGTGSSPEMKLTSQRSLSEIPETPQGKLREMPFPYAGR
jgi:DNA repair exonuclease SbcCD ATPase subunit